MMTRHINNRTPKQCTLGPEEETDEQVASLGSKEIFSNVTGD